jgi:hypothetical protein
MESMEHVPETGVREQDWKKRWIFAQNTQAKGVH